MENIFDMITPGIPDDRFIRDKVPMTKEEVRMISMCKLRLKNNSIIYDIGSGTGSISIEAALLSPTIKVFSIECNKDAVILTKENVRKFNVDNVQVIEACAPDGLTGLPVATHAFIGGTKGNMEKILQSLYGMNPHMRIVLNTVTLESLCDFQNLAKRFPMSNIDTVVVNISRAVKTGNYNMLNAGNPVFVCSFDFTDGN